MIAACPLLLLALVVGAPPAKAADDPPPRERVARVLAEWRAGGLRETGELAEAVVAIGSGAAPEVCRLLDEGEGEIPAAALAVVLGRLRVPSAVPTLGRLASGGAPAERLAAVQALGCIGARGGLALLARAVDDVDGVVADAGESALLAQELPASWIVGAVVERIAAAGQPSRLARLLGRMPSPEAQAALLRMLDGRDERPHLLALQGLWLRADPEDGARVDLLLAETDSAAVTKQACLFLGRVRHAPSTPYLIEYLRDERPGVAANAHWALKRITGERLRRDPELWEAWWRRSGGHR